MDLFVKWDPRIEKVRHFALICAKLRKGPVWNEPYTSVKELICFYIRGGFCVYVY